MAAGGACLVAVSACGNMLDRQQPSDDAYISKYLYYFDETQIDKMDIAYKGAIGGICSSARIQFKGPIKLRDKVVDKATEDGKAALSEFDPTKMPEVDTDYFKHQWAFAVDGNLPSWFDFPFDRKLRVIKESVKPSQTVQGHEYEWYIDDDRNVVYMRVFVN
jgi:hypothetical protein